MSSESSPPDDSSTPDPRVEMAREVSPAEPAAPSLGPDRIFMLLKNQRRRRVIAHLNEADGTVSLSDLAEDIAALEHDTTPAALTSTERKRVYISLYQIHLPKLADANVVVFNKPRGRITLGPTVDQLRPYLEGSSDAHASTRWARYYLCLTSVSSGAVVAILLTSGRTLWLIGVISGLLAGVAILAFLQYYTT